MRVTGRIAAGFALYAVGALAGWRSLFPLLVGMVGTVVTYAMLGWVEHWAKRRFGTTAPTLQC